MTKNRASRDKIKAIDVSWDETHLQTGDIQYFRIGELLVAMALITGELHISHCYPKDAEADPEVEIGPDAQWNRWDVAGDTVTVRFTPQFADLPYIVRAENPLELPQKTHKKVYVKIPVWLSCSLVLPQQQKLMTLPIVKLSKTWFGDFAEGEVCYWISSGARNTFEPLPENRFLAICPVHLSNASPELLKVEKMCVRAQHLSIYKDERNLWSNELSIRFKGKDRFSDMSVREKPPKESAAAKLISGPQIAAKRSVNIRTFGGILDLSPFDFFR